MDLRGSNKYVNAVALSVAYCFPCTVNVIETSTGERGDCGALHLFGDGLNRLKVAVTSYWEPCLDDVDTEARQLLRDLELLASIE
ncbi:unannotated protein [freshwater metagenome]|uniref:Unannotated protein n=1 Tax=freshwater metagenome TaxID=449393 RepID=A0A6J7PTM6_9ZZZZ